MTPPGSTRRRGTTYPDMIWEPMQAFNALADWKAPGIGVVP
jgi:hypothetical protein